MTPREALWLLANDAHSGDEKHAAHILEAVINYADAAMAYEDVARAITNSGNAARIAIESRDLARTRMENSL